jgi:hypothetical protein
MGVNFYKSQLCGSHFQHAPTHLTHVMLNISKRLNSIIILQKLTKLINNSK